MQHTTGVAVLATHLAATDRRGLSQAWYSALHLADRGPRSSIRHGTNVARNAPGAGSPSSAPHEARRARAGLDRARRSRAFSNPAKSGGGASSSPERRSAAGGLARRIERVLVRRARHGRPVSFTLRVANGRVWVLVRSDGSRTRIVAVCAATLRERVARALAHARFALAANGLHAEVA